MIVYDTVKLRAYNVFINIKVILFKVYRI